MLTKVSLIADAATDTDQIADGAIAEAKIADGAVATAKLADGAVTLGKMAGGTAGRIILYDDTGALSEAFETRIQHVRVESSALLGPYTAVFSTQTSVPTTSDLDAVEELAATITPKDAAHRLRITIDLPLVHNETASSINTILGLFKDDDSQAIAGLIESHRGGAFKSFHLVHEMAAGTTEAITFKTCIAATETSNLRINGNAANQLCLGGILSASIEINEFRE